MNVVASFQVERLEFLGAEGELLAPLPDFARDPEKLVALYRAMTLTRLFDARAVALQRTGQLGTFASSLGQEAVGTGVASAMREEDVLVPYYRDHGALLWRGVTMVESLLYWGGDERGCDYAGPRRDFPACVPIATQVTHAAGVACAMKLRGEPRVAVCMVGDGTTSKGDFYEGLNVAGVWHLPMVVVINNNRWAISVPLHAQTAAATLAQKAIAAGIEGLQVDGNDVIAVHEAARRAIERARAGGGPTLVEALTYRLGDHTTADDATRYRSAGEVERARRLEPRARLARYLERAGAWSGAAEERLRNECTERVEQAVREYLAVPPPAPAAMFEHLYAELPAALRPQREAALRAAGGERERG
ncbi:MAG: pyruvate dehydrogenase (acetyl-transferring) E1 component subunit alpha [Burkholderiales bacterium]|nr:pyruvate dehydrogenase (acetyl-transferring) E1 component subunit alpha [Burkholderiales bacterium]